MAYHRPIPHPAAEQAKGPVYPIGKGDGDLHGDGLSFRARLAIIVGLSIGLWLAIATLVLAAIG